MRKSFRLFLSPKDRVVFYLCWLFGSRDRSRADNARHGNWRVVYDDGAVSERMHAPTAYDYADIFGGKVVRADDL